MPRLSLILVLLPSLCALPFLVQSDESDQFKKLAGPPNEFRNFSNKLNGTSLADPSNVLRLPLAYLSVGIEWKYFFPVDPVSSIVVNVAYLKSEMSGKEVIPTLIGPNSDVKLPDQRNVSQNLQGYDPDYAVISLLFAAPDPGMWSIVLSVKGRASGEPQRAITWIGFNDTEMEVMAYTASADNMEYKELSVNAFLTDQSEEKLGARGTVNTMENATLTVTMPNGDKMMKTMAMDKGKGEMGGTFMPLTPGVYTLDVNVEGEKDGYRFARSSIFQIPVASPSLNVTNGAHVHLFNHPATANEIILIRVNVLWDGRADSVYRGYAEVYGTGRSGDSVAVAWVGGLVEVKKDNSDYFIQFELDSRWLITSQATFPLTLKNIVFENLSGYVTIVHVKEEVALKVADPRLLSWKPKYTSEQVEITYEMLNGYNPYRDKFLNSTESGTIVLVHGYCATADPFPINHFTNVRVFRRFQQNLSIDQFARLVLQFVNQEQIGLYSIVAHSQGGMVGTHLLAYYQTSMDAMVSLINVWMIFNSVLN